MNIFIDARWIRTDFHDGISRYTAGIIQGFVDNDIPITILIHDMAQLKMLTCEVPYILVNNPISIKELFIAHKLNNLGADVVYSPFQVIGSFGRKYKLVLSLHDTIYYFHPKAPTNMSILLRIVWRLFHMAHWPQRMLLNSADYVMTVSETSKKFIQQLHLTDREIGVAYNAASLKPSDIHRAAKETKDILYMGSFMPYKNAEVLISGMEHLPHDFTLHLLSKIGQERKNELSRLIKPGVQVVFHNGVTDKEYIELLQGAYCSATGSKEEGFGLPIVEAMMIGTPVVCSELVIFHEVAGNAALFFDNSSPKSFAEQILNLDDSEFKKNLVERGYKQAELFTWKHSAMVIYKVLEKICAKK